MTDTKDLNVESGSEGLPVTSRVGKSRGGRKPKFNEEAKKAEIRSYFANNPDCTDTDVISALGLSQTKFYDLKKKITQEDSEAETAAQERRDYEVCQRTLDFLKEAVQRQPSKVSTAIFADLQKQLTEYDNSELEAEFELMRAKRAAETSKFALDVIPNPTTFG